MDMNLNKAGKPSILQFMGSQRVRHDLVTEQQQYWEKIGKMASPELIEKNRIGKRNG